MRMILLNSQSDRVIARQRLAIIPQQLPVLLMTRALHYPGP